MTEAQKVGQTLIEQMEVFLSSVYNEPVRLRMILEAKFISVEFIKEMVCTGFCLTWDEITAPSRKYDIIYARMSFCYLCRRYTTATDNHIADQIKKDRTSVIANSQTIDSLLFTKDEMVYPVLKPIIDQLNRLKNDLTIN